MFNHFTVDALSSALGVSLVIDFDFIDGGPT
jgi:hypothetical protein